MKRAITTPKTVMIGDFKNSNLDQPTIIFAN
jgi:hypothetical protein